MIDSPPSSELGALTGDPVEVDTVHLIRDTRLASRLWQFVRPHRRLLLASLFLLVVTNGVELIVPLIVRNFFDAESLQAIQTAGIRFLIVALIQQSISFAQKLTMHIVGVRVAHDLRMTVIRFLQRQRLAFFDDERTGMLLTRVTSDTEAVRDLFRFGVLSALGDGILLVGTVVMMLILEWRLALVTFATVPLIAAIVEIVRRAARKALRSMREKLDRMNSYLSEQVDGVTAVQSYCAEGRAKAEFVAINDAHRNASFNHMWLQGALSSAIQLVSSLCIASIFWYVGVHMGKAEVGFGTLVAFIYYVNRFFEPMGTLSARYTQLQSSLSGTERIFDLLDKSEPEPPPDTSLPTGDPGHAFEFENVSFGYRKDVPVLREISFSVRRGEKVAVVGTTGCGKSTLLSLLMRTREIDDGAVRVNGVDTRSLSGATLRRQFSVVPQDTFLFSGTLATNVAAGEEIIDEARVDAAIRKVGGGDLIDRRPGGIRSVVGARGANLSIGERQLVAFARALYRDAPILVLDEATASVDNRTDALLQRALAEVLVGRTALIIAHRLATIHTADRILVLHEGRIVESGNHMDLMALKGFYAKAYDLQKTRQTMSQTFHSSIPPPLRPVKHA